MQEKVTRSPGPKIGAVFETTFYANPKKESRFRFRATHLDGSRSLERNGKPVS